MKVIYGNVDLSRLKLTRLPDMRDIVVTGNFMCAHNRLESLDGVPKIIGGDLYFYGNGFTAEGAKLSYPISVGGDASFGGYSAWDKVVKQYDEDNKARKIHQKICGSCEKSKYYGLFTTGGGISGLSKNVSFKDQYNVCNDCYEKGLYHDPNYTEDYY
jgi:hypothetical protein